MATIQTMIRVRDGFSSTLDRFNNGIRTATQNQQQLNNSMQSNAASGLTRQIGKLISAYSLLTATTRLVNLSDDFTLATSRLSLLTEEMKNANGELETTAELQEKIYSAAQRSRGSYMDMMGSISKLGLLAGDAFGSTDEIVAFTETLNKAFTVGGTGSREKSMAMYQLTQAMGSGRLQGDEFRSIIENAPMVAQSIEDYMRNVKKAEGTMKEWSAQGLLTADVIKAAVFNAADDINKKFETIPYTWGQVWTMCKNKIIRIMQPVLKFISFLANNWSIIEPILLGIVGALMVYYTWTNAVAIATKVWAAAQAILNALLMMNPLGLLIIGIIAVIALIYAVVAAYNKWTGSAVSATGVIVGCIYVVGAIFYNIFMLIMNIISAIIAAFDALGYNIVAAFENSIAGVKSVFYDLLSTASSVIAEIAEKLNKLPFVNIDVSGLNAAASDFAAKAKAAGNNKKEYKNVVDEANKALYNTFEYKSLSGAYQNGYNKGSSWADNISGKWDSLTGGYDYSGYGTGDSGVGQNTADTAKNTAKTADAVTKSSEDLKWLREIAERKAINQFTTAEIKVDMGGVNNVVNSNMDLDGVVSYLEETLTETMASVAEGSHV